MRLPSLETLAHQARKVLFRFTWTLATAVFAAITAIIATTKSSDVENLARITMATSADFPPCSMVASIHPPRFRRKDSLLVLDWHGRLFLVRAK